MPHPSPIRPTLNLLREFSIPLIAGVLTALLWANLNDASYHHLILDPILGLPNLLFLTNDLFMTLFFGIAAAEISSNLAPGGSLSPLRKAVNPLLATAGGVIGPIAAFFLLNHFLGSPQLAPGWGIPTATDIALAWLVARIVFGKNHPCVAFLLLLAIADDAISLIIIAVFYPDPHHPVVPAYLLLILLAIAIAFTLNRLRIKSYWPYLLLAGLPSWIGLHQAHLHPALALVFIIPFLPHKKSAPKDTVFDEHPADSRTTLMQFEHQWKIIVDIGLFFFGLCNAGVKFSATGPITLIILLSLLLGKTAGITLFATLAKRLGFPLPQNVGPKELLLTALIAAIGLTVALFVAGEAYPDPTLQNAAKMGALASALTAPVAILLARLLKIRKIR